MTWDNDLNPSRSEPLPDVAVSRLFHALARRRHPARPWVWERLATREEIDALTKTDLRRAA